MALQPSTIAQGSSSRALLLALLVALAVIALMILATAIFGFNQAGPSYEIAPDPAHLVGLPF